MSRSTAQPAKAPLWPSILVLAFATVVAAGAFALIGWIGLALLGY